MVNFKRLAVGAIGVTGAVVLTAGPALAHECTNASRNAHQPDAGIQIAFGDGDDPLWISHGLQQRIDHLGLDRIEETFHGLIGFDFDGDGIIDGSTYIVGPEGEIPLQAQLNGSPDHGVVNICGTGCEEE